MALPCSRSRPVVVYAFISRGQLPLWSIWRPYLESCPRGAPGVPIVHSQRAATSEHVASALGRDLAPFGGFVLRPNETRQGGTRFEWRMVAIMLSLMRAASRVRAPGSGCPAQYVHFVSEYDAPLTSCAHVHRFLGYLPNVAIAAGVGLGKKGRPGGPRVSLLDQMLWKPSAPLRYSLPWMTLAVEDAAALARDEALLHDRWTIDLHGRWTTLIDGPGRGSSGNRLPASVDAGLPVTTGLLWSSEFATRKWQFLRQGLTYATWCDATHPLRFACRPSSTSAMTATRGHRLLPQGRSDQRARTPGRAATFATYAHALAVCDRARRAGYYFGRRFGNGTAESAAEVVRALRLCGGVDGWRQGVIQ